jgi:hypothetical protein
MVDRCINRAVAKRANRKDLGGLGYLISRSWSLGIVLVEEIRGMKLSPNQNNLLPNGKRLGEVFNFYTK